ncbi:hypothetical protein BDY19DRAFT_888713 [Irpex rosettiformis]|uniref:Uncharacterized protein n=1 Tax=Irpex rosettiformis TaxID=378272 RepID=A0ACB8U713_9APHY|nr:hypothetical protein BDY19DRAFT_888713 [Irpex rosettiformis]
MQQYLASIKDTEDIPLSLRNPCVEDFGDGPRVRDVQAFLNSKIAAPVSFEDPLCAEFGQREVLEMLCCVLPEETAMIAWYNLSRIKSRVCPACKRLYHPGDPVLEEFQGEDSPTNVEKQKQAREDSWKLHNEQLISGICSALCYFLVAHNYPSAIRSTFGRRAEDISDEAWNELNGPGAGAEDKMGLGMLLKMTRCHDMGLEQLILPGLRAADERSESDGYYDDDNDEGSDVELEEELENSEIEEITDLDAEPIYTP